jgi:hypothetical protein
LTHAEITPEKLVFRRNAFVLELYSLEKEALGKCFSPWVRRAEKFIKVPENRVEWL